MPLFWIVIIVILTCIALCLVLYSAIYGISPMPSHKKARVQILKILETLNPDEITDLGSGWGSLINPIANQFPNATVTGYETSWVAYGFSWLRRRKNVKVFRKNIYKISLNNKKVIICYLFPAAMKHLKEKFENELPNGSIVITNTFQIPGKTPSKVYPLNDLYRSAIYVYQF